MRPRELILDWVEAFNLKDSDRIAALYLEDAVNHQVAQDPAEGREAIRAMFARDFESADMVCIVENIFEDGNVGILEWRDPLGQFGGAARCAGPGGHPGRGRHCSFSNIWRQEVMPNE